MLSGPAWSPSPLFLGSADPLTPISLVQHHLPEHSITGMMAAPFLYSSPTEEGNEIQTTRAGFEEGPEVKFTSGNPVGKSVLKSSKLRAECHWATGRAGSRPQKKGRDIPYVSPALVSQHFTRHTVTPPLLGFYPAISIPGMLRSLSQSKLLIMLQSPVQCPLQVLYPALSVGH